MYKFGEMITHARLLPSHPTLDEPQDFRRRMLTNNMTKVKPRLRSQNLEITTRSADKTMH